MTDESPLFRPEALDAQRPRSLGPIVLAQPLSFAFLAALAAACALALGAFLAWGSYTQRTSVGGQLLPEGGWAKVYAPQSGVVTDKRVTEGQAVRAGDVLYVVSLDRRNAAAPDGLSAIADQVTRRRDSLRFELERLAPLQREQRAATQRRLAAAQADVQVIDQAIDGQRKRVALAEDTLQRYRGLQQKDFISVEQVQLREADWLDQRARLQALERDRLAATRELALLRGDLERMPIEQERQSAELRRALSTSDQELVESQLRRSVQVVAPRDGVATAVAAELGQAVDPARPLLSIVAPGARLQAVLLAPSRAVGFVREGQPVMLRFDAFPYQKFGHGEGKVAQVARAALSGQELQVLAASGMELPGAAGGEALYRITVDLARQSVTAYGQQQPLQVGMQLQADILQERRRLYEWVFEPLWTLTGKW